MSDSWDGCPIRAIDPPQNDLVLIFVHFLAKKKAMNNQRERIKRIAEEVTEHVSKRMEFTQNVFEFRGDGLRQKETGSSIWILRFWFQGDQGINFEISVTEDSTDESIKADIAVVLARQRLDY